MSPKWVEESLRAGRWLPEDEFEAKVFSCLSSRVGRGGAQIVQRLLPHLTCIDLPLDLLSTLTSS